MDDIGGPPLELDALSLPRDGTHVTRRRDCRFWDRLRARVAFRIVLGGPCVEGRFSGYLSDIARTVVRRGWHTLAKKGGGSRDTVRETSAEERVAACVETILCDFCPPDVQGLADAVQMVGWRPSRCPAFYRETMAADLGARVAGMAAS